MKISGKDVVLVALAAVIIVVIALFGFPSPSSGSTATTTWAVDFADVPSPISPGNVTTWTYHDGAWGMTSVRNGNRSVWMFENVSAEFVCSKSGASVTIDFASLPSPFAQGNSTTWTRSGTAWTSTTAVNGGHSLWTLESMSSEAKCSKGDTVTTTVTIDFVDAASPTDPGSLTTWKKVDGVWTKTSVANGGHSVWVFENVTSKPNCFAQLQAAESIGGFGDTNTSYSIIGGIKIESLAGLVNQNGGGPGWQYWVNGVYANRSSSLFYISSGDEVTWMYKPLAG